MTNIVHGLTTRLMYVIELCQKGLEEQPGTQRDTPCECDTLT